MLRSIGLILISLLIAFSSHAEVKTSIPDYSDIATIALHPIEADCLLTTILPTKSKYADEKHAEILNIQNYFVVADPEVLPFNKKVFIKQSQNYRSHLIRNFHLII